MEWVGLTLFGLIMGAIGKYWGYHEAKSECKERHGAN